MWLWMLSIKVLVAVYVMSNPFRKLTKKKKTVGKKHSS